MSTAVENYPGELAMFRGLVRTLRIAARYEDMTEVQRLLYEHDADERAAYQETREKSRPTRADATPLTAADRQQILLGRIRAERGEWTTRRTHRTYRALGITGVFRSAVRADLASLHSAGHLVLNDQDQGRRFYIPSTKGGIDV